MSSTPTRHPAGAGHFSNVHTPGHRILRAGESVLVDWEAAEQDGYAFRTVRTWPAGQPPADPVDLTDAPGSSAYGSTLTLTWDDGTTITS